MTGRPCCHRRLQLIWSGFATGNAWPWERIRDRQIVRGIGQHGTVGQLESTGRIGAGPTVTSTEPNYLLVWTDFNSGVLGPVNVFGSSSTRRATRWGTCFVSPPRGRCILAGVAFGSGHYLVTYSRVNLSGTVGLYGRFVSTAGCPRKTVSS